MLRRIAFHTAGSIPYIKECTDMNMLSLVIGLVSLSFAGITYLKSESTKRRLRIELNRVADDSGQFLNQLTAANVSKEILNRYESLNHSIVLMLSIDRRLAREWVWNHKPQEEWRQWEKNLQISMKKYGGLAPQVGRNRD